MLVTLVGIMQHRLIFVQSSLKKREKKYRTFVWRRRRLRRRWRRWSPGCRDAVWKTTKTPWPHFWGFFEVVKWRRRHVHVFTFSPRFGEPSEVLVIQPSASGYHFCLLADKLRNSIFECKEARTLFFKETPREMCLVQILSAQLQKWTSAQPFMETSCYNLLQLYDENVVF